MFIGKWLLRGPRLFILDEPTRGIDVGAKYEVYKIINRLAAEGTGILMISSEIEELIGMCDRILVMGQGEIRGAFDRADFDREAILRRAMWDGVPRGRGMNADANRVRMLLLQYAPLLLFLLLAAVFASLSDRFLTPSNFINIVTQAAHIAIIAIGMTFVLLVAGIDLSVGANMYASCIIVALYLKGWNPIFGFFVAGTLGLAFGACNAFIITRLRVPAFIATLWRRCSSAAPSRSTSRA